MNTAEVNPVEFDERVDQILRGLGEGKTREQMAQAFGYKNYKSLDTVMRRKNFGWDKKRGNYFPLREEKPAEQDPLKNPFPHGRAGTIISLLKRGMEPREIAKQMKFDGPREMAKLMRSKGYEWDEEGKNYVFKGQAASDSCSSEQTNVPKEFESEWVGIKSEGTGKKGMSNLERFLPLLEFLDSHSESLSELILSTEPGASTIPRYILPGVNVTKSVHMVYGLDQMVREFSAEKNISQKEIFEVALVHFFQTYGYRREVDTLLGT
jgi:hypothetical protein